ncbi:menaquinone-dependent protoporphyrinogen oxidase [Georgenia satyanarayanai]|uniref:Menaquinone-dependent protoporphyrinogen oxidase n=1 Tax=Georgenia satyanarayanai TaxID=860221 RepID=A0A2Y9AAY3_9MICO|nr:flavodoxin domain-containing protein [Georgenia satyanarayanai]PYF99781.1 menaquinone-dependent protoporphyrinogen oxidase [Georgenia satyanarayanai]SSA41761.1 menaquinone-dependent protoporphyrinogen oxidase [Georgenia satyanarayanai]
MRILVVAASKHSSTSEVADTIGAELESLGHAVRREPAGTAEVGDAEAVVLGSAVYMSRWMGPARDFAERNAAALAAVPTWVFSVGLAGAEADDPLRIEKAVLSGVDPVGAATFDGRLDPAVLNLRERSVTRLTRAPEGDQRDWTAIRAWAGTIDRELREHLAPTS